MVASVGRQAGNALQGVGHPQIPLRADGDRKGVMGVTFRLVRLGLCDRHEGTHGQRDHLVPARYRRDGLIGAIAGGDQITARQGGFGPRGEAGSERLPYGPRVLKGLLSCVSGRRSVTISECGAGQDRRRYVCLAAARRLRGRPPDSAAARAAALRP